MKLKKLSFILLSISSLPVAVSQAADTSSQLETVVVKGTSFKTASTATDGDQRDFANLGVLGKQNVFTSPITVVNYDEQILDKTKARNLVDTIAQTDASTWSFGGETNTLQGLYIRGYQLDAKQFSLNGLSGMYSYQSSPTAAVSSAQLIKGASTAIGGMDPEGAVSGAVTIETKKATDKPINKIGLGYFTNNRLQGSFDIGRRFGANQVMGIRVNGLLRHGDTPRHGYSEDNKEFALNTDYRGENLTVALDLLYAKRKTQGGRARFQDLQNLTFAMPKAPDGSTNLVPSWQGQTTEDKTAMLTFGYETDVNVKFTGGIGYSESSYTGNFAALTMLDASGNYCVGGDQSKVVCNNKGSRLSDQSNKTLSMNLAAHGNFQTGAVDHNWNAAFDRVRRVRLNYWGSKYTSAINTNIYNPNFGSSAETLSGLNTKPAIDATQLAYSLALTDTLGFVDNQYRLTLGGRLQWVFQDDRKNSQRGSANRFSPVVLLAWVPNPDLVVYGNYMEDLEPGSFDSTTGEMSSPRVSKQIELGVRKNWGDVVTSLNVFQISRPGYWREEGVYNGTSHNADDAQGKERNRGVEFSVYANLLDKTLRPSLGVMYLDSDLIDYPTYKGELVNGVQVANPKYVVKAGIEWDTSFLKGLTLNAGLQYYGKSYQDAKKAYAFPSYTIVNMGAAYTTSLSQDRTLTVRAGIENLFNKAYWQVQRGKYDRSFAVLGMPRTFWLTADLNF
ncbi:TonB-dependent receptor [Basilea psittacipulmonis]|uniref:Ligand-gated channel protein n=1 Tax=Basilea psittacipulmonis DSM 24701 TaxID=1072685 RepID=A0A077DFS9_9BURK|nr:TonB-dependent siderophore receptor [Basilea psittacipulmonis]AIL32212.1 ligand-gated channel protein [Basilea psittacipulmonis DSM 24701]